MTYAIRKNHANYAACIDFADNTVWRGLLSSNPAKTGKLNQVGKIAKDFH